MHKINFNSQVRKSLPIQKFFDLYKDNLKLKIFNNSCIDTKKILSDNPYPHRPSLAFTGFFDQFPSKKTQLIGFTEWSYLKSLTIKQRKKIYQNLQEKINLKDIPAWIVTNHQQPFPDFIDFCKNNHTPLFVSEFPTEKFQYNIQFMIDKWFSPFCKVHGTLVDVYGVGILYIGKSGVGKSECALDLIERGHSFISDDSVHLEKSFSSIVGKKNDFLEYHMEVRGIGIINIQSLFGIRSVKPRKTLNTIVELQSWDDKKVFDRSGLEEETVNIFDIAITKKVLPVTPGKNLTVMSEVIAMDWLLKNSGVYIAKEFNQKLKERLQKKP